MPPPKPLACVKSHVEHKWLAEVHNGDLWLPYTAWQEQFEPTPERKAKREDPEWKKKHKAKAAAKAKETLLHKIQDTMTDKMTLLVLEIAARVLNMAQERLSEAEQANAKSRSNIASSESARLMNCISGVILAYRFARHSTKHMIPPKAKYYKAASVEHLADHLDHIMTDLADRKLPEIQRALQEQFDVAHEAKIMIAEKLDEIFNPEILEEKTDELLDMAAEKVVDQGNAFLHKIMAQRENPHQSPEVILQSVGLELPRLPLSLPQLPDEQVVKERKNEMVHLLAGIVREKILSQLENICEWISFYVDQILAVAALATTVAAQKARGNKLKSSLQELVDSIYEQMQAFIAQEVSKVIGLIGAMMDKPFEEKGSEADE